MHQATDSRSYCDKVNRLLNGERLTLRKPWGIQTDGDLWEIMEQVIRLKGIGSLRVTWVKGHASQEHFEVKLSSPFLKRGNDKADLLADRGVTSHTEGLLHLAYFYVAKQKASCNLLARIHSMFIRVLFLEAELRQAKEASEEPLRQLTHGTAVPTVPAPAHTDVQLLPKDT